MRPEHVRSAQGSQALVEHAALMTKGALLMPHVCRQAKSGSAKKARRKAAKGKDMDMVPHYSVLACEYHVSIVAGLSLIGVSRTIPAEYFTGIDL